MLICLTLFEINHRIYYTHRTFYVYMEHIEIDDGRLDLAVTAAERAGSLAESIKHTTSKELKDDDTIVTEADKEAEDIVRNILGDSSFPILGEEHGGDVSDEDSYWVVDPIDGTTNFSYGQPVYGSAIGLVENGEPVVGVVYMPEFDYLFYAVEYEGAYRNHEKLEINSNKSIDDRLYTSLSGKGTKKFYEGVGDVSHWIQELHSAVAGECWVASGWSDVGVFGALAPWDMAAGTVILRESGGVLQNVQTGSEDWADLKEGKVVFGERELVEDFREQLSDETVGTLLDTVYSQ